MCILWLVMGFMYKGKAVSQVYDNKITLIHGL